jgi:predicted dehydrogenase
VTVRRALVVGLGSIGTRHRDVLEGLGLETEVLSRRTSDEALAEAVARVRPDHVVLAREAVRHADDLRELAAAGFRGSVVVEKPLGVRADGLEEFVDPSALPFRSCTVGYQLRLHPVVLALRAALSAEPLVSVDARVGQHLDAWRPGRDPAATASGSTALGGGALRELSHELDLVTWLGGPWRRVCALGGRSGALASDVDDRWGLLIELDGGVVATVHLDMLDRVGQRRLTATGPRVTAVADLVAGMVRVGDADGVRETAHPAARDDILGALHTAVLDGGGRPSGLCDLAQGFEVVRLIEAAERSVTVGGWVSR